MKSLLIAASALTISGAALAYQNDTDPAMPVDASQMQQDVPGTQTSMEYDQPPVATTQDMTDEAAMAAEAGMLHEQQWAGMGGPYEEAYGTEGLNLTPRPAMSNYAACAPGPGDDNCIQLYEPGVRTALASWSGMGGYAGGESQAAMGGPYEPADRSHSEMAAHGDDSDAWAAAQVGDDGMSGVGGPVEAREGYPPCQPGDGDDNCIQLYERGVTGN